MRRVWQAILWTALFFATPSWAVYKCMEPNGKISYQDTECVAGQGDRLNTTDNLYNSGPSVFSPSDSGGTTTGPPHSPLERMRPVPRTDPVVHTGPRGGRFRFTDSGNKSYVRKGGR